MKKFDFSAIRVFVFDLDDTLFDESLFARRGTYVVLKWLARYYGLEYKFLREKMHIICKTYPRNLWYQKLMEHAGIPFSRDVLDKMVEIYRNHHPRIHLYTDAHNFLARIKKKAGTFIGLITDGMVSVQKLNVSSLELSGILDISIFTWERGSKFQKPDPWSFKYIENLPDIISKECCYFGNDPNKDFFAPNCLGWSTVCIYRDENKKLLPPSQEYAAQMTVKSFDEINID